MALIFRRKPRDPTATMTVVEHLEELRRRIIISVGAVAVGMVGGWFLFPTVFDLMTGAFCDFMTQHPSLAIDRSDPCRLAYQSVTEPFLMKIKVVAFIGLALALPVVLYQLWRFITPGLLPRERRYALPFVLASLFLFALGGWFAVITLPKALNFLLGFAGEQRLTAVLSIARYVSFVLLVIAAFGAAFEFPVVLISLTLVGVISSDQLRRWRRYALLGIAVTAAVITPSQDVFTMVALMVPLLVFYELSILISRVLKR